MVLPLGVCDTTYALSVKLISLCVYHTNVPGYHNRLCNPVTDSQFAFFIAIVEILPNHSRQCFFLSFELTAVKSCSSFWNSSIHTSILTIDSYKIPVHRASSSLYTEVTTEQQQLTIDLTFIYPERSLNGFVL